MIAIIDYGMGNLRSVQKGFERIGFAAEVTADPARILAAEKIVLPGVGAFRDCIHNLEQGGFVEPILQVIAEGRPFLGICLGLQLLFSESEEFGLHKGLGVIPGRVVRSPRGCRNRAKNCRYHTWLEPDHPAGRDTTFNGISDGSNATLSTLLRETKRHLSVVAATCNYGLEFCAAIRKDNVMATPVPPEKSQAIACRCGKTLPKLH